MPNNTTILATVSSIPEPACPTCDHECSYNGLALVFILAATTGILLNLIFGLPGH